MTAEIDRHTLDQKTFDERGSLLKLSETDGTIQYTTPLQKDIVTMYHTGEMSERLIKITGRRLRMEEARLFTNLTALHDNTPIVNPSKGKDRKVKPSKIRHDQV